ncbi:MAG: ferredoxin Fer [Halobacteriales archaeon]
MDSPFETLGVDPDAGDEEIERAYRRRVKEVHPDQGGSAKAFRAVRAAYEALTSGEAIQHGESGGESRVTEPARTAGARGADQSGARGTDRSDDASSTADSGSADGESGSETYEISYLNYEVLADRGWSIGQPGLFEEAAAAGLDAEDYGSVVVEPEESLLEAAERCGFAWPYACRGGACANCAVAVVQGDMGLPVDHILPEEMTDRGIRLSCVGAPITEDTKVVFNIKHLPDLEDLRLPPHPFDRSAAGD